MDKAATLGRTMRSIGNWARRALRRRGDLHRRFFVLDGQDLRYFRDESRKEFLGVIELGTVRSIKRLDRTELRPGEPGAARAAELRHDLPRHTLLLETDARTFTLVPESDTQSVDWQMRLSAVLDANKRRGLVTKSLRHSHRRMASRADDSTDDEGDAGKGVARSPGGAAGGSGTSSGHGHGHGHAGGGGHGGGGGDLLFLLERRLDASHEAARAQPDGEAPSAEAAGWSRELESKLSAILPGMYATGAALTDGAAGSRRRPSLVYAGRIPARASAQLAGNAGVGLLSQLDPAIDPDAGAIGGGTNSATAKRKAGSSGRRGGADAAAAAGGAAAGGGGRGGDGHASGRSRAPTAVVAGAGDEARAGSSAWSYVYNHRPRARQPASRWEEISGNVPRSCASLLSASRLCHTGVLTPLVSAPDLGEEARPGGLFPLPGAPPVLGGHARPAVGRALDELKRRKKAEKTRLKEIKKARAGRGGLDSADSAGVNSIPARTAAGAAEALKETLRELSQAPAAGAASSGLEWSLERFAGRFLLTSEAEEEAEEAEEAAAEEEAEEEAAAETEGRRAGGGSAGADTFQRRQARAASRAAARAIRRAVTARVATLGECLEPLHRWLEGAAPGEGRGWKLDPWLEGHVAAEVEATLEIEEQAKRARDLSVNGSALGRAASGAGGGGPGRAATAAGGRGGRPVLGSGATAAWVVDEEEAWESELRAAAAAARILASGGDKDAARAAAAAAAAAGPGAGRHAGSYPGAAGNGAISPDKAAVGSPAGSGASGAASAADRRVRRSGSVTGVSSARAEAAAAAAVLAREVDPHAHGGASLDTEAGGLETDWLALVMGHGAEALSKRDSAAAGGGGGAGRQAGAAGPAAAELATITLPCAAAPRRRSST
ncbi:hypothetical protein FNF28_03911 [Cafeteria roenbergensis]|uniref:PH domain-containing protein n=1 Tax=Cafeteria roenbergensis TaxID=33653 RepID=A0A5A8DKL6_CAFRO|nr:hypothetical protein FNF28_03911 [Cafeteria roenbergensis]